MTGPRSDHAAMVELGCTVVGVALVIIALGQWALPGASFDAGVLYMKAGITVAFGLIGAILWRFASGGLAQEVHVDLGDRSLRAAARNRRGKTRVTARIGFEEIAGAFIQRSRDGVKQPRLFIRFHEGDTVYEVARGDERELMRLHSRLTGDLQSAVPRGNEADKKSREVFPELFGGAA
ncbi:MAG: hypothetical protein HUJ27_13715 [Rhodobacteraceae bacterium]|nr:hypothetical protein [Paracoccaceae bacterium]